MRENSYGVRPRGIASCTLTVAKFDGNAHNIQKLEDAMNILGLPRESKPGKKSKDAAEEEREGQPGEAG